MHTYSIGSLTRWCVVEVRPTSVQQQQQPPQVRDQGRLRRGWRLKRQNGYTYWNLYRRRRRSTDPPGRQPSQPDCFLFIILLLPRWMIRSRQARHQASGHELGDYSVDSETVYHIPIRVCTYIMSWRVRVTRRGTVDYNFGRRRRCGGAR